MRALWRAWSRGRFHALVQKEFRQILRDRRLVISLTVAPVLQLLLLGAVLNATVSNVSLGVVDDSHTPESRELVAELPRARASGWRGPTGRSTSWPRRSTAGRPTPGS